MGFYIRKSVSVGPLRFNLSKSGIGVSGGIKGLRLGTGPRGTYVHAGRGGLYYRQYLFTHPRNHTTPDSPTPPKPQPTRDVEPEIDAVLIASAPASQITDSSATALLNEIQAKRRMAAYTPIAMIAAVIAVIAAWAHDPIAGAVVAVLGVGATVVAALYDEQRRAVVVMYDLDAHSEAAFKALYDGLMQLRNCAAIWSVMSQVANVDYKRQAGAANLITRKPAFVRDGPVPFLKTNVVVPSLVLHKDTIYFFPDKIFITNAAGVGAVSYLDFQTRMQIGRFIEDGPVPRDAMQVDVTWRYLNKNGSPDRRFSNNRQLPILAYQDVLFASETGVRAYLQVSNQHGADAFLSGLDIMRVLGANGPSGPPPALATDR